MSRHPHADLMIAYANDTSITLEYKTENHDWQTLRAGDGGLMPAFVPQFQYRIKPEPESSMTGVEAYNIYLTSLGHLRVSETGGIPPINAAFKRVVNEAVRRYIKEQEEKK